MTNFERIAFFTIIENIEKQLQGVKTLLAATNPESGLSGSGTHKVTRTMETDSPDLTDEQEDKVEKAMLEARETELNRMRKSAETHYQKEWDKTVEIMAEMDG